MLRLPILAILGCFLAAAVGTWLIGSHRTNVGADLRWGRVHCAGQHRVQGDPSRVVVRPGARCLANLTIANPEPIGGQLVRLTFHGAGVEGRSGVRLLRVGSDSSLGESARGADVEVQVGKGFAAHDSRRFAVAFQVTGCPTGGIVPLQDMVTAEIRTWHRTGTSAGIPAPVAFQVRGC